MKPIENLLHITTAAQVRQILLFVRKPFIYCQLLIINHNDIKLMLEDLLICLMLMFGWKFVNPICLDEYPVLSHLRVDTIKYLCSNDTTTTSTTATAILTRGSQLTK